MGEIEEERLLLVLLHEPNGFLGVTLGQRGLVNRALDDLRVAHQRHVEAVEIGILGHALRPAELLADPIAVVRIRQAKERIKAVLRRQIIRQVAQVPFADGAGRIAFGLQGPGNRDLVRRQPAGIVRIEHMPARTAGHAAANGQPPGQQRRPAGRAERGARIEIGEAQPLGGHPVEVGRANARMTVAAQVAIAQVVGHDDDDVGSLSRRRGGMAPPANRLIQAATSNVLGFILRDRDMGFRRSVRRRGCGGKEHLVFILLILAPLHGRRRRRYQASSSPLPARGSRKQSHRLHQCHRRPGQCDPRNPRLLKSPDPPGPGSPGSQSPSPFPASPGRPPSSRRAPAGRR